MREFTMILPREILFDSCLQNAPWRVIIINISWRCVVEYMTTKEAADKWGIKIRQVQSLCEKGQIESATRLGVMWVMPKETQKPVDGRTKEAKKLKWEINKAYE